VVAVLGKFPLPVEVIKMALPLVEPRLAALGLNPKLRQAKGGTGLYLTDEGNYILDCACGWRRRDRGDGLFPAWRGGRRDRPRGGDSNLNCRAVVEHGTLFLGRWRRWRWWRASADGVTQRCR
jgi:hypothetical protein